MSTERRIFKPGRVVRSNSGGLLWAPIDQHDIEYGITPSHDKAVIQKFCDLLNKQPQEVCSENH